MCRLFAVRADRPVSAGYPLAEASHSLRKQSCCDLTGQCHASGWGIGHFADGKPHRVRSTRPAGDDPLFADTARSVVSRTILSHVRLASVGSVAERNCHPFVRGRWMFAHNGTLTGFDANPEPLRRLIPPPLLASLEGETDSIHIFALLLARLEQLTGSFDAPADADAVARLLAGVVRELAGLFPDTAEDPTRLNFVLTDGEILVASRWGHTLYRCDQRGLGRGAADARAVGVGSEPATEQGWEELPDRMVLTVRPDLTSGMKRDPGLGAAGLIRRLVDPVFM